MNPILFRLLILFGVLIIVIFLIRGHRKNKQKKLKDDAGPLPDNWKDTLNKHVTFYRNLNNEEKVLFEERVKQFWESKTIEPISTEIDDTVKLMVAASAIIPVFSFPHYNYPNLKTVLIYPNTFDEKFQTDRNAGSKQNISGMVGNRFMNGTMIISKPDLVKAYDGKNHKFNVGIHEFVHLLDKEDGLTDGIPELFLKRKDTKEWIETIKKEVTKIEYGKSDINPYALTNHAEFFAVISEYFFNDPEEFKDEHPGLYDFLAEIFNQNPE